MTIYYFDETTGIFLGAGTADVDQLEPGGWILPPNCTTEEPPQGGRGHRWAGGVWAATLPAPAPVNAPPQPATLPTLAKDGTDGPTTPAKKEVPLKRKKKGK